MWLKRGGIRDYFNKILIIHDVTIPLYQMNLLSVSTKSKINPETI